MLITTTLGDRDDSTLRKTEGTVDNDVETTTWVEYCVADCPGVAHQTGRPDQPYLFCAQHIHRSVHVTLKQGVELFAVAADLGKE
jgi:hypothetical protein